MGETETSYKTSWGGGLLLCLALQGQRMNITPTTAPPCGDREGLTSLLCLVTVAKL